MFGDGDAFSLENPKPESQTALPFSFQLWGAWPGRKALEDDAPLLLPALTVWLRGTV